MPSLIPQDPQSAADERHIFDLYFVNLKCSIYHSINHSACLLKREANVYLLPQLEDDDITLDISSTATEVVQCWCKRHCCCLAMSHWLGGSRD